MTDIYVNFFMSTQETCDTVFFIILNFFTIYSVLKAKCALNIVPARILAKTECTGKNSLPVLFFCTTLQLTYFSSSSPLPLFRQRKHCGATTSGGYDCCGFRNGSVISTKKQSGDTKQQPPIQASGHQGYGKPLVSDCNHSGLCSCKRRYKQHDHDPVSGLLPGHSF